MKPSERFPTIRIEIGDLPIRRKRGRPYENKHVEAAKFALELRSQGLSFKEAIRKTMARYPISVDALIYRMRRLNSKSLA